MLNFTSDLITAYKKDNTRAYWLLRLYYGDESNFIGFGSKPVVVGSDVYWEALDLGRFGQSTDLDDFIVSNGTMSVTLPNTPKAVEGGRFSDMFVSKKFTNRKWELFQASDGVTFSTDNMIASGIIGADFDNTDTEITVYLNDLWLKYDIQLPLRRATKTIYADVPEKNIDEPIPMWYGNFDVIDDVPVGDFERHFVKGRVPALIVDKSDSNGYSKALPDSDQDSEIILKQLNEKAVAIKSGSGYMTCDENNTIITDNPPSESFNKILFKGIDWFGYYSFADFDDQDSRVTDEENMFDDDFVTFGNFSVPESDVGALELFLPSSIDHHGVGNLSGTDIIILANFGTFTGTGALLGPTKVMGEVTVGNNFTWNGGSYQTLSDAAAGVLVGDGSILLVLGTGGGATASDVDIKEIGIQAKTEPSTTFSWKVIERGEQLYTIVDPWYGKPRVRKAGIAPDVHFRAADVEMAFISGKGREYGSWIDADSRNNGYNQEDLIENPVYIIEDILRNELGLTSSEIDYASFDVAGNTTNGIIGNVFNDSVVDIKFAFSQYRLISAKTLIRKVCKLSGLYFFWSAGKAKVIARKRSYSAVDDTIDFRYIAYPSPENSSAQKPKTSLTRYDDIINFITTEYDFDYGENKTVRSSDPNDNANLEDSNSQTDYNQTLKSTTRFDLTLDETTANNFGEAQIGYFKDRKSIIEIETTSPRWNHLENTDIINIDNFTSDFTLFGTEISLTNTFMIIKKSATLNGSRFKLVKLPGSV